MFTEMVLFIDDEYENCKVFHVRFFAINWRN